MSERTQIILWASTIIVAALFLQASDLDNGASLGIIAGLTGAAIGTTLSMRGKRGRC